MNRRGFLSAMLGAAMAPAVVRSESIMKLWTPSQEIWVPEQEMITAAAWVAHGDSAWYHLAISKQGDTITRYVNGQVCNDNSHRHDLVFGKVEDMVAPKFTGNVSDILVSYKGAQT
jgi:hypothetical protein